MGHALEPRSPHRTPGPTTPGPGPGTEQVRTGRPGSARGRVGGPGLPGIGPLLVLRRGWVASTGSVAARVRRGPRLVKTGLALEAPVAREEGRRPIRGRAGRWD